RRLLAHELTHVVQQRGSAPALQRQQPPGAENTADQGAAAPKPDLTAPITTEAAANMERPVIVGLLLMIQKRMQDVEKDSAEYQALKRNFDTLQSALQQVCGPVTPQGPAAPEGALLVRMTPAGMFVVDASEVLHAQKNKGKPPAEPPQASMPE